MGTRLRTGMGGFAEYDTEPKGKNQTVSKEAG